MTSLDPHAPDRRTRQRMLAAFAAACDRLQIHDTTDTPVWGWRGRTLSRRVLLAASPCWMRLAASPKDRIAQTFWRGNVSAEHELPGSVPKPRLLRFQEHDDQSWAYATEVFELSPTTALSPTPATLRPLVPTEAWWQQLRTTLNAVATVPTTRYTITPAFLATIMAQVLGHNLPPAPPDPWVTSHGDLHWANLAGPTLTIFDWEGWGLAPTGYDAATLLVHSLHCPLTTTEVRRHFADQLDTPAGRYAQQAVLAEHLWIHRRDPHNAHAALMRSELERLSTPRQRDGAPQAHW